MADNEKTSEDDSDSKGGKLRQMLHAATGDRDAEAKALADRTGGEVNEKDALAAVERAHGERRDEEAEGVELASVKDAKDADGAGDPDPVKEKEARE